MYCKYMIYMIVYLSIYLYLYALSTFKTRRQREKQATAHIQYEQTPSPSPSTTLPPTRHVFHAWSRSLAHASAAWPPPLRAAPAQTG